MTVSWRYRMMGEVDDGYRQPRVRARIAPDSLPRTVLLVDCDESIRDRCAVAFRAWNYRVIALKSATKALTLFWEDPEAVDIVVAQAELPEMGGQALAAAMRRGRSDLRGIVLVDTVSAELPRFADSSRWLILTSRTDGSIVRSLRSALRLLAHSDDPR